MENYYYLQYFSCELILFRNNCTTYIAVFFSIMVPNNPCETQMMVWVMISLLISLFSFFFQFPGDNHGFSHSMEFNIGNGGWFLCFCEKTSSSARSNVHCCNGRLGNELSFFFIDLEWCFEDSAIKLNILWTIPSLFTGTFSLITCCILFNG